jgi:hypothetical protein
MNKLYYGDNLEPRWLGPIRRGSAAETRLGRNRG